MHAAPAVLVVMLGWLALLLAALGSLYMLAAAGMIRQFFARAVPAVARDEAVTLLKPLHGAEPRLADNLATFLRQDHRGPIQLLCGVARADDPAVAAVEPLGPGIDLVIDPTRHGASGKIGNLVNLAACAAHGILILSDSDIAVAPDYLARVLAALDEPGVGAVTCLYRGRGDAGRWSRLAAAGLSYQFLPGALFGVATGLAHPCMGSTIALRRETLDRIGGFTRFADTLADDHAIGAAVESLGLRVVVPPMLVTHASAETSLAALWRHELRWGATVRGVAPGAYAASVIALPLPLALIGAALAPGLLALGVVGVALASRLVLVAAIDRQVGEPTASPLLIPLRDCLSFAVFLASFFARSVDWRGSRLRMSTDGRIAAEAEIP